MNAALRLLIAGLLTLATGLQAETLRNPFVRPPVIEPPPEQPSVTAPPSVEWKLRGMLVAGAASLVNLDGTLIAIGEEVNGFRLIEVSEQGALFQQGRRRVRVSITGEQESD